MIKSLLALVLAALFTGACLYVTLVEHQARLRIDGAAALAQWKESARRAAPMQATLALLTLGLGLWAWWKVADPWLLAGALLVGVNIPLTLIAILPLNRRLEATAVEQAGAETQAQLARWGRLHALRTLLGILGVGAFLVAFWQP